MTCVQLSFKVSKKGHATACRSFKPPRSIHLRTGDQCAWNGIADDYVKEAELSKPMDRPCSGFWKDRIRAESYL